MRDPLQVLLASHITNYTINIKLNESLEKTVSFA